VAAVLIAQVAGTLSSSPFFDPNDHSNYSVDRVKETLLWAFPFGSLLRVGGLVVSPPFFERPEDALNWLRRAAGFVCLLQ